MTAKRTLNFPIYLFNEGTNFESYRMMKVAYVVHDGKKCWRFRCWAPNARSVSVVGDFNAWDRGKNPMQPVGGGIWEGFIRGLKRFDNYKFSVEGADGQVFMKADPFALHAETPPATASKIYDIGGYKWGDEAYYQAKQGKNPYESPMNIYEMHLGSWRKHEDGNYFSYRDVAKDLVPYLKDMGYTHVELMPLTEHPFEGSWGYQVSGLFAPTSRFGTPHDLMYLIDCLHQAGIGVILDMVLSHFPKDRHGLYEFDGTSQYEYDDPLKREHKGWGTMVFDYGKPAVRSFLISAACFWIEYYHIDGLRLDAVASMLYLDYDRKNGEWRPNKFGGNYNLEAIQFLQTLNKAILTRYPGVVTIAEESTAFPMVTMPPDPGGLGFNFKWNMGWMNDVLDYVKIDPFFRKGAHNKLTFSISYAFNENFILPFSHDEVVHGKASMISKMPGNYHDKFAALKSLYAYQMAHPGKKLNFMGNEFGQFIEWNYQKQLDWLLLEYDSHFQLKRFVRDLNRFYLDNPPFYELDDTYDGFKWIIVDDNIQNVVAFMRVDKSDRKVIVLINFSDVKREGYEFGVPDAGDYEVALNSNAAIYGGDSALEEIYTSEPKENHGFANTVTIDLEGNSAVYLRLIPKKEEALC